jgi:hypothetical protein
MLILCLRLLGVRLVIPLPQLTLEMMDPLETKFHHRLLKLTHKQRLKALHLLKHRLVLENLQKKSQNQPHNRKKALNQPRHKLK